MNTHMDRTIFTLGVSVPATSLYILICSLLDEGQSPTLDRIRKLWNESEEVLDRSVDELLSRGVLEAPPSWLTNGQNGQGRLYLGRTWLRIVQTGHHADPSESLHTGWLS